MSPASIALIVAGVIVAIAPVGLALLQRRFARAGLVLLMVGAMWGGTAYANFGTAKRNKDIVMALLLTSIGVQFGAFVAITPSRPEAPEP